jgi:hypothetical protein
MALYDKLRGKAGPIGLTLDRAAQDLAEGKNATDVKQRAYREIRDGLKAQLDQFAGVQGERPGGAEGLDSQGPLQGGEPGPLQSRRVASEAPDDESPAAGPLQSRNPTEPIPYPERPFKDSFEERHYNPRAPLIDQFRAAVLHPYELGENSGLTLRPNTPTYLANAQALHALDAFSRMPDEDQSQVGGYVHCAAATGASWARWARSRWTKTPRRTCARRRTRGWRCSASSLKMPQ